MIGLRIQTTDQTPRVKRAADRAAFRNVRHAGASIRITARRSIRKRKRAAPAGRPPHTRGRSNGLKRAIAYDVAQDQLGVIVGPQASVVGESGQAHEFGGEFRGDDYPARPFMGPALDKQRDRLAPDWEGTIGE